MITVRSLSLGLALGTMMGLASASQAQVINYVSTVTLTNPNVNGVTITALGSSDTGVVASGLGTSDQAGTFQVASAPPGPTYTPYSSTFTDVLAITDVGTSTSGNIIVTGTLTTAANSGQVLPGSTSIVLNPALYSITLGTHTYFVSLNNFDEVAAAGSSRPGSFSYRFSEIPVVTGTPEPGSIAMLVGMGTAGAGFLVRRRRSK